MTAEQKRDALDRIAVLRDQIAQTMMSRAAATTRTLDALAANPQARANLIAAQ
jgi:hypothetical protein